MFELNMVFLVSARMCEVTLEKRLYTRSLAAKHIAHPLHKALEGHLGVSLLVGCTPLKRFWSVTLDTDRHIGRRGTYMYAVCSQSAAYAYALISLFFII